MAVLSTLICESLLAVSTLILGVQSAAIDRWVGNLATIKIWETNSEEAPSRMPKATSTLLLVQAPEEEPWLQD